MNDEIKEILDYLQENSKKDEATKQLVDYITNLQQENERLKEYSNQLESNYDLMLKNNDNKLLMDYKSRCEKAVEYINNFSVDKSFSFPLMKRWEENQVKSSIDYEFNNTLKKDLLNILNGRSDK